MSISTHPTRKPHRLLVTLIALAASITFFACSSGGGGGGGGSGGGTSGNNNNGSSGADLTGSASAQLSPNSDPQFLNSNPTEGATEVPITQVVTATFDMPLEGGVTCQLEGHSMTNGVMDSHSSMVMRTHGCIATVNNDAITIKPNTSDEKWIANTHYVMKVSNIKNKNAITIPDESDGTAVQADQTVSKTLSFATVNTNGGGGNSGSGGSGSGGGGSGGTTTPTATDTAPPSLVFTPINGQAGVPLNQTLSALSNETLKNNVTHNVTIGCTITASPVPTAALTCTATLATDNKRINIAVLSAGNATQLADGTNYSIELSNVQDLAGNGANQKFTSGFTTVAAPAPAPTPAPSDQTPTTDPTTTTDPTPTPEPPPAPVVLHTDPPKFQGSNPANQATNVPITQVVTAIFDEPLQISGVTCTIEPAVTNASCKASVQNNIVTITPASTTNGNRVDWANGTNYVIKITGVKDSYGIEGAGSVSFSFTTAAATAPDPSIITTDTTPPKLLTTSPTDGKRVVPVNQAVLFTFNEALNVNSLPTCKLTRPGATAGTTITDECKLFVNGTTISVVRTDTSGQTIDLENNRQYTVRLEGVKDTEGNTALPVVISFLTKWAPPGYKVWQRACLTNATASNCTIGSGSEPLYLSLKDIPDINLAAIAISQIRPYNDDIWVRAYNRTTRTGNFAFIDIISSDAGLRVSNEVRLENETALAWSLTKMYQTVSIPQALYFQGAHGCHALFINLTTANPSWSLTSSKVTTCAR